MRFLFAAILSLGAITGCSSGTSTDSAEVILDRHVAAMKAGDLEAVMADYADDALVIAPDGIVEGEANVAGFNVFDGAANISKLFAVLTNEDNAAGMASMTATYEYKGSDVAMMHWVQFEGEPNEVAGTDVWIIRDGKIINQTVLVNPPPAND
jgi:hypothetical protein